MNQIAEKIIERMRKIVVLEGMDIVRSYPKDLEIDANTIRQTACRGATFFWCVGDSHTHLYQLGISKREQENVGYVLNLSGRDQFYVISVSSDGAVCFDRISSDRARLLMHHPVPYRMEGMQLYFHDRVVATIRPWVA
jgi:hypothetical protein